MCVYATFGDGVRPLSNTGFTLYTVFSLTCLMFVKQRPSARKGDNNVILPTEIPPLDANTPQTWVSGRLRDALTNALLEA